MAGYDSTQLYSGTFIGGVFTITGSPTATNYFTDDFETTGPGALTYEAGDEIAIIPSLDGGDVATYVGHIGDGFLPRPVLAMSTCLLTTRLTQTDRHSPSTPARSRCAFWPER